MKLNNNREVTDFIHTVSRCKSDVYLITSDGRTLNLKRESNLYLGIGYLLEAQAAEPEVFTLCREDTSVLLGFFRRQAQETAC